MNSDSIPFARTAVATALLCLAPAAAVAGPAVGQFELKEVETEAGELEFQSQNAISWGQPRRAFVETEPGDFDYDDNTVVEQRYALEVEYGWTDRFRTRAGIEFEKERIDDPDSPAARNDFDSLELQELAGEAVLVLVPLEEAGVGLAMLAEFEFALDRDEADALTYGPLVEWRGGEWEALANLYLVSFFGGEGDEKTDFAYALRLLHHLSPRADLAVEAYGTVDRLGSTGSPSVEAARFGDHDQHRLGPILYYDLGFVGESTVLGLGLFAGLTEDTPDGTLKLSLEIAL